MTNDELRALADCLDDPNAMQRTARRKAADYLRAQADAQPVAWRCEVRDLLTQAEQCLSTAVQFAQWAHDEPPSYLSAWDYEADHIAAEIRAVLAAAPAAPQAEPCIGNDPTCPCQDGDACHYRDAADGTKGWPVPQAEPKLGELMREQRNSRIVAGAYPDGNPNAGAIMAQTSQAEPKREPLSDEQITKGEYVLATKFSDGDPGDHWGVGFYDRFENGRHYVIDIAGKQIRGNGFRRAGRITADVGRWLLSAAKSLEASPPGTVNLWTMLTERAYGIGDSNAE